MKPFIPVTVVTGFLGSGKTTLLSNLLKHAGARRLAILVNEFGKVCIDGALLRKSGLEHGGVEVHDLSGGLVAYSEDDQFLPVMAAIREPRNRIDHVLIETSGLALPTAVMQALQGSALAEDFCLDATLAVVDTPLLLSGCFAPAAAGQAVADVFNRQLEFADIVVLNKIDALHEGALLQAETQVRELAPGVRFLELAWGARLDARLTLGLRLHEASPGARPHHAGPIHHAPGADAVPLPAQSRFDGHSHVGFAPHVHGLATHKHFHERDPGWQSFVLCSAEFQQAEQLRTALMEIARAEPILRLKGFAAVAGESWQLLVQGVRSRIELRWTGEEAASRSEIVFIGYHPNRARVAEVLGRLTGTRWG
ncbi:MAG TPA: GTP-binding protein [Candidatus Binataceae bacterium]|nr:GTP-binding protein [Candidatus Binataceae bacterium]